MAIEPCCDYRDHGANVCACPEHEQSNLHPFGGGPDPADFCPICDGGTGQPCASHFLGG